MKLTAENGTEQNGASGVADAPVLAELRGLAPLLGLVLGLLIRRRGAPRI